MNPTTIDPTQPPPQPQLTQPPRSSFSCDRHPDEQFTGFCPECLCERLTTLDNNANNDNPSSSSRRPSTSSATAAIKSLFSKPSASNLPPKPAKSTSFFPELRRTKSFSASKNEALGFNAAAFEPQRKSCDVRGRNTLWSLFSIDDETKTCKPTCSQNRNDIGGRPVKEEEEEEEEEEPEKDEDSGNVVDEIVEEELPVEPEIVVEEEVNVDVLKPIKDYIDLDSQAKKAKKEIGGSFWSAASVFSKKWHNWRKKQKLKKRNNSENGENSGTLHIEKPISRRYNNNRDTQSEIADYGFGRRSCDTDPRFSLDAGRMSFDDPRYSFDEPRASWDGYLIGRSFPRMPPMVSVIEDAPVVHIPRFDHQIPVEEPRLSMTSINEDEGVPGGSIQTKEYYSDSSSRRRKSLDRSNSIRKTAAAVVAEMDQMKAAAVLPATGDQYLGAKVLVGERDSNSNSNSLRGDDCSETFELTGFRDNGNEEQRKESKKSRRWAWNLWGFIHRRVSGNKDEEDDRYSRSNGVERSFSESWQDLRTNGDVRGGINRKVLRSNSSVSWRNSNGIGGGSFGSVRKSGVEMNGHVKKKRDDIVLERNRSARYSPNHLDNGLLRFYLAPMRGSRRGLSGKSRPNGSHSIARSLLRLY
ncbi:putative mitogen-activated protein kinase-binding protein 1-like [Capsicum annuum]|uniref:Uncharacterized protein n=1 Tax=Capsicum annuum TaxID=4072 RepID=A0A1U8E4W2_CAPAN|nr:protein OCTOPUS [Capsicum annuum]KAF3637290.1 putative mitogen-activated protein kinase-binding protein 1-like [Capsicum annuum]KAF3651767.1 putative mitogen-activated protein kinase-binding protein 1-like [Capsicum annuum]PHT72382.1 hypothetical protein T459_23167 [Capsicum annuum]